MNIYFEVLKNQIGTFLIWADGLNFFLHFLMNKLTPKFLHASIKLLTNSENHFSKPLQRPYSGYFNPENANRKPPIILKIVVRLCTVLWARICKRLRSPRVDFKESIPPAFVECRSGPPGNIGWRNRFLGSFNVYKFGSGETQQNVSSTRRIFTI